MKPLQVGACALAVGALLAGCQSTVPGTPTTQAGSPTEPSFSTPRPSRTPPPSSPPPTATPAPSQTGTPPGAQVLPSENGYSFIETKSGQTRCQIDVTAVGCEAAFTNAPKVGGEQANGVETTADGKTRWLVGNLGDPPVVALGYQTYSAQGWTIIATEASTRFTNDKTGHGMSVSIEKVEPF
ncbi:MULTISPECIES: hypothetical protein [unclassified Mycobacterium]|uniref:hypothetical protein n=1 Tax=unclassified Mycobacterium TaxID=2642494 RepID=UPI0029C86AC5|nr:MULTISPECIES: hypothetical protein [unclassified Mycobacterium]